MLGKPLLYTSCRLVVWRHHTSKTTLYVCLTDWNKILQVDRTHFSITRWQTIPNYGNIAIFLQYWYIYVLTLSQLLTAFLLERYFEQILVSKHRHVHYSVSQSLAYHYIFCFQTTIISLSSLSTPYIIGGRELVLFLNPIWDKADFLKTYGWHTQSTKWRDVTVYSSQLS